ncbi:hypothetical protein LPB73_02805 [Tardiphaga sp. 37S4]|jgi:hypothetical protein|uniref:hypothetical protein n=1 Tax=Tardiphaga TaxID=1395974 RepID=UPI0008A76608|nr:MULTISPECIES: hypothetical protein [Tardiphaga]MDR6659409.1 hypothetical protein [Tardiphaga robiniae]UFS76351.1 hypothetical protein LPB73_02805 [Tardiphaga sp. 37S4]SEI20646.1 hypothetical protein SAMN05216367_5183 [Tardiphaga sp. OK245]
MSDAVDYFKAYAERAICRARNMRPGRPKVLQRAVGRVYHWLSKEAALGPNTDRMDDFRTAREVERTIGPEDASPGR